METADPWTALGDPTRREVYRRVVDRPRSVTEIAAGLPVSRPAVSQHLRVLVAAELIGAERRGRERIYSARPDGLRALRADLESFWSQTLQNFKQLAEAGEGGPDDDEHD